MNDAENKLAKQLESLRLYALQNLVETTGITEHERQELELLISCAWAAPSVVRTGTERMGR